MLSNKYQNQFIRSAFNAQYTGFGRPRPYRTGLNGLISLARSFIHIEIVDFFLNYVYGSVRTKWRDRKGGNLLLNLSSLN